MIDLLRRRLGTLALLALGVLASCGAEQAPQLVQVPSEREANEILVALHDRGIRGDKQAEMVQRSAVWRITVPEEVLNDARRVLVDLDLPRTPRRGLEALFESGAIIPSRGEERARMMFALSEELARTLEMHERVIAARVHVVLPEQKLGDGLSRSSEPASAAVFLRCRRDGAGSAPPQAWEPFLREAHGVAAAGAPPLTPTLAALWLAQTLREARSGTAAAADRAQLERDLPLSPAAVCELVARGVEGLRPENVRVVYSFSSAPPSAPAALPPAERGSERHAAAAVLDPGRDPLLTGLTVLLALSCAVLVFLLLRQRQRLAVPRSAS